MSPLKIIPVLDLLHGTVVRGIAGRRSEYAPLVSPLVDSSDPRIVANAFRERFGLNELYVADLDAILHDSPNWPIYQQLRTDGFQLMLDAGLRTLSRAEQLIAVGIETVVAGLESCPDPEFISQLAEMLPASRWLMSLDLRNGTPITSIAAWRSLSPIDLAAKIIACGTNRLLLLDLADVGTGTGGSTAALAVQLRQRHPELALFTGGGVRHAEDLQRWQTLGIKGVLIASALHDGRITAETLHGFR